MKFAIPFLLSAAALASLAWMMANFEPVELPPGVQAPKPVSALFCSKS